MGRSIGLQHGDECRVVWAGELLLDGERALVQRERLGILRLGVVGTGQIHKAAEHTRLF